MSDLSLQANGAEGALDWLQFALDVYNFANPPERVRERGRIEALQFLSAGEGGAIPKLFGRMRLGGRLIWRSEPREISNTTGQYTGGKNFSGNRAKLIERNYHYEMSFAIALCEGPISHIGRIWADGKLIENGHYTIRLHEGAADQAVDPLIEGIRGRGKTPAYRGIAYVVFQDFDLTAHGNRVPQLSFEVFRQAEDMRRLVKAVNILPGATEFGYDPTVHIQALGPGRGRTENIHASQTMSDWQVSMDQLQASLPDCGYVALVVAWFGTDLRAGLCRVEPRVEITNKSTLPHEWSVAGLTRAQAHIVSQVDNRPAFGGTPSDGALKRAIADLKNRGLKILFYPFIMMDIPSNNRLANPQGGNVQPAYPWRGDITCYPAPGRAGSPDGSNIVATQIRNFTHGSGASQKYSLYGMMSHYAQLCAQAGGVDAFLIGSELRGLAPLRRANGSFPFAEALVQIAARVRQLLPNTKISYAADWSSYGAHVYSNGDVDFPLDGFWASSNCDFVGLDAYFPLSDWRDGVTHLDAAVTTSVYDLKYLESRVAGGEYYDWYYRNKADRDAQNRSPISDGLGEPWLYRAKDILGWWQNAHRRRRNGVRSGATAWQTQMKPIWFTELGCPAVDKGSNQPNVFPDAKSAAAGLPYYSSGARDDFIQRNYLKAVHNHYALGVNNPRSSRYSGKMIPDGHIFIWAWDARPFPAFPYAADVWTDSVNWARGHWLNGRLSSTSFEQLIGETIDDGQMIDSVNAPFMLDGFAIDGIASRRDILQPLLESFGIEVVATSNGMRFTHRGRLATHEVDAAHLVWHDGAPLIRRRIDDSMTLPSVLKLHYYRADSEYDVAIVSARRPRAARNAGDGAHPIVQLELPVVMSKAQAQDLAERLLHEAWSARETLSLTLPYRFISLEAGDIVRFDDKTWRVRALNYTHTLNVDMVRHESGLYAAAAAQGLETFRGKLPRVIPRPELEVIELPAAIMSPHTDVNWDMGVPLLAAYADPWPQSVSVLGAHARWRVTLNKPAMFGETLTPLPPMPEGRWLYDNNLVVRLYGGMLESRPRLEVLGGANRLALKTPLGWEIIQFSHAELIGVHTYRLDGILRGINGSDGVNQRQRLAQNARCVMIDDGLIPLPLALSAVPRSLTMSYGPAALAQDSYAWQTKTVITKIPRRFAFAPAHIRVQKIDSRRFHFSWIPRIHSGSDFDAIDDPLTINKRYYVRILRNNLNLITRYSNNPYWVSSNADYNTMRRNRSTRYRFEIAVSQVAVDARIGYPAFLDITELIYS